jgi:flavin reductase (DIM6/NTAB) family NADH-FMN oxidoreductase RutF
VFIDCAVERIVSAGDHLVVIGRGLRTEQTCADPPLLYHRGRFHKLPTP